MKKMGIFRSVITAMVVAIRGVVKYGFHCMKLSHSSMQRTNFSEIEKLAYLQGHYKIEFI